MATSILPPALEPVGTPLNLIPVGLKEAAFDSPTFRATAVHFSEQAELIERWLEGYVKATSKLVHEVTSLEDLVNSVLSRCMPPPSISEAIVDPDYTLLAAQRYGEGAREFWSLTIQGMRKMEGSVVEPIRTFLYGGSELLRQFKDARKALEVSQRGFDNLLARFSSQAKTKEPSALREDAFQLHEARKTYLKASMDFCVLAPQLRASIDKLLVRLFSSQWMEMRRARDAVGATFARSHSEMERVRGWSKEMEVGERTLKGELQLARRQIEETAESLSRPSRELDYYAQTSNLYSGPSASTLQQGGGNFPAEKQGWLFVRTLTGKPTRTLWLRRWYFVRHGIFGWLVQGQRSGGVEESEKIGVLLCNVKAATQEERRFCFEVKTKDNTILLQAETQAEFLGWIGSFEAAKRKALEDSSRSDQLQSSQAAFAISPPSAPEFALKADGAGHGHQGSDELASLHPDRSATLPVPDRDAMSRGSFDVSSSRRPTGTDRDGGESSSRDHAARIIHKLDLHRKSNASQNPPSSFTTPGSSSPALSAAAGGGIASLISASHNILPVYSTPAIGHAPSPGSISQRPTLTDLSQFGQTPAQARAALPPSTLAPSTLANPPSATNLSKAAVTVSGERGAGLGRMDVPGGVMANHWGSNNWGFVNRLEGRDGEKPSAPSPAVADKTIEVSDASASPSASSENGVAHGHRKTMSLDDDLARSHKGQSGILSEAELFPPNYPVQLRTQEAQFRMLFPNVSRAEKVVLVFRGTWSPNDLQEFPGRIYVTQKELYFYSHHLGMVLISGMTLASIDEVTAAPGKDCDFLFIHMKDDEQNVGYKRVNVKIFLEPLRLLQRRLNFLIQNASSDAPLDLEPLMTALLRMENEPLRKSPSLESWEDLSVDNTAAEDSSQPIARRTASNNFGSDPFRSSVLHVDHSLGSGAGPQSQTTKPPPIKFRLPSKPVVYEPRHMDRLAASRDFDISPKALFHVLFGDKSAIFQLLYQERWAQDLTQSPWTSSSSSSDEESKLTRQFTYNITLPSLFGSRHPLHVSDTQTITTSQDHLVYSVLDAKTPWHLPLSARFTLLSTYTITHQAKSKAKLAIHTAIRWHSSPPLITPLITRRALDDLAADALDLLDILADQVRRLGAHSRTRKAVTIFGPVGHLTSPLQLAVTPPRAIGPMAKRVARRTLASLLLDVALSWLASAASTMMMALGAALKGLGGVVSANALILLILGVSVVGNMVGIGGWGAEWRRERRAVAFMGRMGFGVDAVQEYDGPVVPRHVFVTSIAELISPSSQPLGNFTTDGGGSAADQGGACFSAFSSSVLSPSPTDLLPLSSPGTPPKAMGRGLERWTRVRAGLARRRNDLLVGLRVVESVEREAVRASWKEWVLDEEEMCRRARKLVGKEGWDGEEVGWLRGYCENCWAQK